MSAQTALFVCTASGMCAWGSACAADRQMRRSAAWWGLGLLSVAMTITPWWLGPVIGLTP